MMSRRRLFSAALGRSEACLPVQIVWRYAMAAASSTSVLTTNLRSGEMTRKNSQFIPYAETGLDFGWRTRSAGDNLITTLLKTEI